MKRRLKNCICFVLLIVFAINMSACGSKTRKIENLMTKFEHSCNELDLNTMLDCLDPNIADTIKLATGIAGMFADKDTNEMLEGMAKVLLGELPSNTEDFFSSIQITTRDIKMDGNTATANAIIKYTVADEDYDNEAMFEYVYTDEKWYISNLKFE